MVIIGTEEHELGYILLNRHHSHYSWSKLIWDMENNHNHVVFISLIQVLTYNVFALRLGYLPFEQKGCVSEKDFLEAMNKVIKGYKKFSATIGYMLYI